jgi:hypothetical protein
MQTWRSEEDTGLAGKGKEEVKLKTWYEKGRKFGSPFNEVFATMDPKSSIWHNRLGYWPTKPWEGKGLITLAGDAAHPMTFRKNTMLSFTSHFCCWCRHVLPRFCSWRDCKTVLTLSQIAAKALITPLQMPPIYSNISAI